MKKNKSRKTAEQHATEQHYTDTITQELADQLGLPVAKLREKALQAGESAIAQYTLMDSVSMPLK